METIEGIELGTRKRITGTFTVGGTVTNPTVTTVRVIDPDGVQTLPAVVEGATGVRYVDVDLTKPGPWVVKFTGSGAVVAPAAVKLLVAASPFDPFED